MALAPALEKRLVELMKQHEKNENELANGLETLIKTATEMKDFYLGQQHQIFREALGILSSDEYIVNLFSEQVYSELYPDELYQEMFTDAA